ncbi:hypothetical protein T10_13661 [Trichinella papuae]|uniref:Uncharacterized protein n=1 Tax=Trichinella papuae TaxID=268474 RepID=A0A0V1MG15_9BILA|nr:hypothetical protein T10_13661 [Trichinella papuae]
MHFCQPDKMCSDNQSSNASIFYYISTAKKQQGSLSLVANFSVHILELWKLCLYGFYPVNFRKLTISVDQIEYHFFVCND